MRPCRAVQACGGWPCRVSAWTAPVFRLEKPDCDAQCRPAQIWNSSMRRRQFIAALGAAAALPLAARAQQQAERVRRIGVLNSLAESDPESAVRLRAFEQALKQLGWNNGANLRIDFRWSGNNPELVRKFAAELIAMAPDAIVTSGSFVAGPMVQATANIPIVFLQVVDPVGSGLIESMAQPGGNVTGFTQ